MKTDIKEDFDLMKDEKFIAWVEARKEREDIQEMLEFFILSIQGMHPRSIGCFREKLDPIRKEFMEVKS